MSSTDLLMAIGGLAHIETSLDDALNAHEEPTTVVERIAQRRMEAALTAVLTAQVALSQAHELLHGAV